MDDRKVHATFHPGTAPVYAIQPGGTGERPWVSPGAPPWDSQVHQDLAVQHGWPTPGEPDQKGRWTIALVAAVITISLLLSAFLVQRSGLVPAGIPVLGRDSGLAACEMIANGGTLNNESSGETMTKAEYQQLRDIFDGSRFPAIRDHGTRLMDYAWQMQSLTASDQNALAALPLVQPMTEAYTGLAAACADHGHVLPGLGG
jgi:hypothetical protein